MFCNLLFSTLWTVIIIVIIIIVDPFIHLHLCLHTLYSPTKCKTKKTGEMLTRSSSENIIVLILWSMGSLLFGIHFVPPSIHPSQINGPDDGQMMTGSETCLRWKVVGEWSPRRCAIVISGEPSSRKGINGQYGEIHTK